MTRNEEDMSANGNSNGHEQRIQRVEEDLSDLKTQHAELNLTMKYIGDKMSEVVPGIISHLDASLKPLTEKFQEHVVVDEKAHSQLNGISVIVNQNENARIHRKEKWSSWKKGIYPVFTGALAIALKELVALILRHM